MIKNIVFDMGQVLVSYVGNLVCQIYIEDEQERKDVSTSVFASPEWVLLDMGVMPEEEALKKMQERLDTERKREQAEWCFWHWHEYNMNQKRGWRNWCGGLSPWAMESISVPMHRSAFLSAIKR